jgi:opacity protein-like surface antigen
MTGISDYQGELSEGKLFNSYNGYSASVFYRHDINKRYAVNGGFMFGSLPTAGDVRFFDVSMMFEFSFYEFEMDDLNKTFTPYLSAGIGANYYTNNIFIPFALGMKYNLSERAAIGAEWKMRKTTQDNMEANLDSDTDNRFYNNDYYSSIGIFITYKFFKFADDCPVY